MCLPTSYNFFCKPAKPTLQWTDKLASVADKSTSLLASGENSGINQSSGAPSIELDGETPSTAYSSQDVDVSLRLEGPYFTAVNPSRYKTVICYVAGTGISGAIAIARAFLAQKRQQRTALEDGCGWGPNDRPTTSICERCVVIWSVRAENYIDLPYIKGTASFHNSSYSIYTETDFV
jgi:hypothetical protein